MTWSNGVSIPPDSGGSIAGIISIQNNGFYFSVGNTNNSPVNYNLTTVVITTNDLGNYYQVLSNLNNSLARTIRTINRSGTYYRYETGTSMAAADVSGVLALMQDYFTNIAASHAQPGVAQGHAHQRRAGDARITTFKSQTRLNFQGWGLINLPESLPPGITNH